MIVSASEKTRHPKEARPLIPVNGELRERVAPLAASLETQYAGTARFVPADELSYRLFFEVDCANLKRDDRTCPTVLRIGNTALIRLEKHFKDSVNPRYYYFLTEEGSVPEQLGANDLDPACLSVTLDDGARCAHAAVYDISAWQTRRRLDGLDEAERTAYAHAFIEQLGTFASADAVLGVGAPL